MKERISITIDRDIIKRFRGYCKTNGMKVSSRIESIIIKELKRK